jgi:hypothetical protein
VPILARYRDVKESIGKVSLPDSDVGALLADDLSREVVQIVICEGRCRYRR